MKTLLGNYVGILLYLGLKRNVTQIKYLSDKAVEDVFPKLKSPCLGGWMPSCQLLLGWERRMGPGHR